MELARAGARTLAYIGVFGLVGVLLDLDHVPVLVLKGIPITVHNIAHHAGRPLHWPALVGLGLYSGYCLASCHRLLRRSRLAALRDEI